MSKGKKSKRKQQVQKPVETPIVKDTRAVELRPISWIVFAVLAALCFWRFGLTWVCLRNWIFLCCLYALSVTDLETMLIPNRYLIIPAVTWCICCFLIPMTKNEILMHFAAGVAYGGGILCISLIMDRILKRDTMGGGDIKLFAVCGLYLGFIGTLLAVIFACVIGLIFVVARKKKDESGSKEFPFGPSIAVASGLMLLFGQPLIDMYMSLLQH